MMKDDVGRVSIPGRIIDLLLSDDEFYREVSSLKKASASGRFPKCDQWCDDTGFHMAFALAGYSPDDIDILSKDCTLMVNSKKFNSIDIAPDVNTADIAEDSEEYPVKQAKVQIQQGIIVRGIARRSFRTKIFVRSEFDLTKTQATMKHGLLEITVPRRTDEYLKTIDISSE
jgi:HSP20 family molecular chaperone IbpA